MARKAVRSSPLTSGGTSRGPYWDAVPPTGQSDNLNTHRPQGGRSEVLTRLGTEAERSGASDIGTPTETGSIDEALSETLR